MNKWTTKKLDETDDLTFAICILSEWRAFLSPYSPLAEKLNNTLREIEKVRDEHRKSKTLMKITKSQWNTIPNDYKGRWKESDWNVPKEWIGKRTVLEGCLPGGHGAVLVTEGIHFEIVSDQL